MPTEDQEDKTPQLVLMNEEEQYSLWPKYNSVPNRWKVVKEGTRAECLAYVKEVWTDMRPLSLRKHMEKFAQQQREAAQAAAPIQAGQGAESATRQPAQAGTTASPADVTSSNSSAQHT